MTAPVQIFYQPSASSAFDDITNSVRWRDARFVQGAGADPGECSFRVRDKEHVFDLDYFHVGGRLQLFIDGSCAWDGYVFVVAPEYAFDVDDTSDADSTPRFWAIEGWDRNILFAKRAMFDQTNPTENNSTYPAGSSDQEVVRDILSRLSSMGDDGVNIYDGITEVGPIDPYEEIRVANIGDYLRDVFRRVVLFNGAVIYIDPVNAWVRYVDDATPTAPFGLSDKPGDGEVGYRSVTIRPDGTKLVNDDLVWGVGLGGSAPVFARAQDAASIAEHGLFQNGEYIQTMWKQLSVDRRADTYVNGSPSHHRGHKDPAYRLQCTIFEHGLRAGMAIPFSSWVWNHFDTYPIRKIEMTFPTEEDVQYVLNLSHELDAPWSIYDPIPPFVNPGPSPTIEYEAPGPVTEDEVALTWAYTVRGQRTFTGDRFTYSPPASTDVGITNTISAYDDPGPAHVVHHDYTWTLVTWSVTRAAGGVGVSSVRSQFATLALADTLKISALSTVQTAFHYYGADDLEIWFQIPAGMSEHTQLRVQAKTTAVASPQPIFLPSLTFRYSATPPDAASPLWPGEFGHYLPAAVALDQAPGSTDVRVNIPPLEAGYLGVFLDKHVPWFTPPNSASISNYPVTATQAQINDFLASLGMRAADHISISLVRPGTNMPEVFARFDPVTCIYYTLYPYVKGTLGVFIAGTTSSTYVAAVAGSNGAKLVMDTAVAQVGRAYVLGTEGPYTFDCSGLVYYCFNQTGQVSIIGGTRRTAKGYREWFIAQGRFTTSEAALVPGNLIIYGADAEHIAIYLGNGKAISALNPTQGVLIHRWDGLTHPVAGFCQPDFGGTVTNTTDYGTGPEVPPNAIEATSGVDFVELDPDVGSFKLLDLCQDLSKNLMVSYVPTYKIGEGSSPAVIADPSADANGQMIYRPASQLQTGWGTKWDGFNCGMTASAMALDRHTLGAYSGTNGYPLATPPNMRTFSGVVELSGTTLADAVAAWHNGWRQTLIDPGNTSWGYFVARVAEGRGAIANGLYSAMPFYLKKDADFNGPHSLYINEVLSDGSFWGYDPLFRSPLIYPADILRTYMQALTGSGLVEAAYTQITAKVVP